MAEEKGRGLFEIRAIRKSDDKVILKEEIVAESESDAMFESGLREALKAEKLNKDDVYLLFREFGAVPKRERAKTVRLLGKLGKHCLAKED